MAAIFFFNGRDGDFNCRLEACQRVFSEENFCYDPTPRSCHNADNFEGLYAEFIENEKSKICFLHVTPLQRSIRRETLEIPREGRECVYVVWFSGGPIEGRKAFLNYFENSIFAPPTENGDDPSSPRFWRAVRRQIYDEWEGIL